MWLTSKQILPDLARDFSICFLVSFLQNIPRGYHRCYKVHDVCDSDDRGQYNVSACKSARQSFRGEHCAEEPRATANANSEKNRVIEMAATDDGERVEVGKHEATIMKEMRFGGLGPLNKTFFCCALKADGKEYGFFQTSLTIQRLELAALSGLVGGGGALDKTRVVVAHPSSKDSLSPEWALPTVLKDRAGALVNARSGYWVQERPVIFDFKPKLQSLECDYKILRVLRVAFDERGRSRVQEGLKYIKARLARICSVAGQVRLFVEVDGHMFLSDVVPNESGETCADNVSTIAEGIDKCIAEIQTLEYEIGLEMAGSV